MPSSGRLVLHVGLPKSGTTYVQERLLRNAAALAERGVLVPVGSREEGRGSVAFRAALDLTGRRLGRPAAYAEGRWAVLVEQAARHDGTVVVSHEAFSRCTPEQAARAVEDLGRERELHVVVTARDPGRLLVSAWLEGLKHGTTRGLADHVRLARAGELPVLRTLDLPAVVETWASVVPAARVHVVTVPASLGDRSLLWPRFCTAAGLPADAAPREPVRTNESLGVAEAQVMLALNRRLGPAVRRGGTLHRVVSQSVAPRLAARAGGPVALTEDVQDWARTRAEAWRDRLVTSGVDVVGSLDDLRPGGPVPAGPSDPSRPHPDVAQVAVEAVDALADALVADLTTDLATGLAADLATDLLAGGDPA